MSEYTYGNLVRMKYKDICNQYVNSQTRIITLNPSWICLVMEQDKYFMNDIDKRPIANNLIELSKQAPILFFAYPEDHGFGFSILHDGKTVNSFYLDYMGFDKPSPVPSDFQSTNRTDKSIKQANVNVEAFRLFECSDKQIEELANLLNIELRGDDLYTIPNKFKRLLDLQEMEFVSWDYVQRDDFPHNFFDGTDIRDHIGRLNDPASLLQEIGKVSPDYLKSVKNAFGGGTAKSTASPVFTVGETVKHRVFGIGKVINATPMGGDIMYEVQFENLGVKKLMGIFANLEKA